LTRNITVSAVIVILWQLYTVHRAKKKSQLVIEKVRHFIIRITIATDSSSSSYSRR